ncbi:hypothetical protein [Sphingopyxis sp. 113P3]|uniref:hypothetical protein n=1 Tax=Sphingopyxis sp. (strain 113P3) TaxID=292913 RepID=UPI0006AD3419|nr:hypothetical protein [Sphingopyxis sp. 113P3]ALC13831.1 hypothetical protein LH20_17885 [Sphingopyxis sp. 113P3]
MSDEYKTYRANAEGFDGDKIRVEGEVFTTNITQGSWMDLLDDKGNVVERPKAPAPAGKKDKAASAAGTDTAAIDAIKAEYEAQTKRLEERIAELEAKAGALEQPNPGPLDSSIEELTAYLETLSDVGTVEALIKAEEGGKSRKGALEALSARRDALQGA